MKYKALLFDLDDTLWATFDNNKASLHRLYDEEGWGAYYATFEDYFAVYFPHQEQLWDDSVSYTHLTLPTTPYV